MTDPSKRRRSRTSSDHAPRHERQRLGRVQVVQLMPDLTGDLQDVAEALGAMSAAGPPVRVITAFVATVVAWSTDRQSPISTPACAMARSRARKKPSEGSSGVDRTLPVTRLPDRLLDQHDVGEGAADIDGDAESAHPSAAAGSIRTP